MVIDISEKILKRREADRRRYAEKPERQRAASARWTANNSEKKAETERRRIARKLAENPDFVREQSRRQRARDPEGAREAVRNWNANNPGKGLEATLRWQKENPDMVQAIKARRRARKAAAIVEPIRANFRALALVAWNHQCAYCHCDLRAPGVKTEWDHFRPIARCGAEAEYNYVPTCAHCNGSKHARDPFAFLFDIKYVSEVNKFFQTIWTPDPVISEGTTP